MKVPLKWLREYVDVTLSPTELANRLTLAGAEVKAMATSGGTWENIVIGQLVAINPHPNADRLRLATVNLGAEQLTVVCGAPNLRIGDKIAFAPVGAQLIDSHSGQTFRLSAAKIRGVTSSGMICSEKELGISDNQEGIMVLSPEAPVGKPLAEFLGDVVFDLDITPNRADCLSVIGIAWEVAALTSQKPHIPEISYEEIALPIDQQISVEIVHPDLCSRYCASLITGVKIGESPAWMQKRLLDCGMRPINNVVDITNYVMLEYGQPLHAFDYERIRGKKIIVRRASDSEKLITLDGNERILASDMLVIADETRAVALAGVMGGANSEVTEGTTSILLEAANFNPENIHYTARKLMLTSEASMRFERGIRAGLTIPALRRATQLIIKLAGGKAAHGVVDVYPVKQENQPIRLSTKEVKRILGIEFNLDQIVSILTSLGFDGKTDSATSEVVATAPYWRGDIRQAVDLIEEVARIIGYDKIPMTLLSQQLPQHTSEPSHSLRQKIRQCLIGYGFQEIVSYSLVGMDTLNKLIPEPRPTSPTPIRLDNPMTSDQEYLRPNLRTNLLTTLAANRRHESGGIQLFELGKVYLPRENDLPAEPEMLGAVISGARAGKSWLTTEEPFDFFDAKGVAEGLLKQLNVTASFEPGSDESLHPTRQLAIAVTGNRLGVIGELHPKVTSAFELTEPVYLFEINMTELLPFASDQKLFQPIPRFPNVARDLALVVDFAVTHQQIQDIITGFPLVSQVTIFDVYSGKQVPPGKKSLAYRIVYRSPTHTLTDAEVNEVQQNILDKLSKELGATLRG